MCVVSERPLVGVVITTAAKEDVRWSSIKTGVIISILIFFLS